MVGLGFLGLLVIGALVLGAIGFFIAIGNQRKIRSLEEDLANTKSELWGLSGGKQTEPDKSEQTLAKIPPKAAAALESAPATKTAPAKVPEEKSQVISDGPETAAPDPTPEDTPLQPPRKPPEPAEPGAFARGIENFKANW